MTIRVGINGFGRIGRHYLRAARAAAPEIEIVAVNDLTAIEVNAHLLRYDSTHGRYPGTVEPTPRGLSIDGHEVLVLCEREPAKLPWSDLGVAIVVESTGRFTNREGAAQHLVAGAERVIVSAPATGADATFVVGVNDAAYDPAIHVVVSNASCTTNCFVPMVKVLDDAFSLKQGLLTTVHAYTNDQQILDLAKDDLRRARAAAINIVPNRTGAARATGLVLQAMQGRLDGVALRVPVPDGSISDLTGIVLADLDVAGINAAFAAAAAHGPMARVLDYCEDPIVSSDIVGSPASCTFDSTLTMAQPIGDGTTLVKVFGWYDNEWGYANRLVDLTRVVGGAQQTS
jgi:glyceraldehyde 3-phosphate dehydrogenase